MAKWQWSQTFAANATADPNINWAEGMSPSSVNDSARAQMGVEAQDYADNNGTLLTTGTSTGYLVTSNQGFGTTPQVGMRLSISPHVTNGTPATITVDGIPAKPLRSAPNVELANGALAQGTPYRITYFASNGGEWICTGAPIPATVNVPYINIVEFGAKGDGSTLNGPALQAAVSAALAQPSGGTLYAPAGRYIFGNNPQTISYPTGNALCDITIIGDGQDATVFNWSTGNGLTFAFHSAITSKQSMHMRDLSLTTSATVNGTALALTQLGTNSGSNAALSELTRVTIRGDDTYAGFDGWAFDVNSTGISNLNLNGCCLQGPATPAGAGLVLAGLNSSNIAVVVNLIGTTINSKNIGLQMGAFVQGVVIGPGCNITGCLAGVNVPSGLALADAQLVLSGSQIGVFANGAAGVVMGTAVGAFIVDGMTFVIANGNSTIFNATAIDLVQSSNFSITNSIFQCTNLAIPQGKPGNVAITVSGNTGGGVGFLDNNTYTTWDIAENLTASSANVNIGLRNFVGCTTPVVNGGSNNFTFLRNAIPNNFACILQNSAGAGAHGIDIACGATGSDSSTLVAAFFTGDNVTSIGSISRNGTGVSYNTTSDRRLKRDIADTASGLAVLRRLRIVDYASRGDPERKRRQGIIAQEAYKHWPQGVRRGGRNSAKQPWLIAPLEFVPLNIVSTQQLADIVDDQNEEIKELKRRLGKLERRRVK